MKIVVTFKHGEVRELNKEEILSSVAYAEEEYYGDVEKIEWKED